MAEPTPQLQPTPIDPPQVYPAAANENAPPPANDNTYAPAQESARPPHTQTQSTLAPTSEFVRYLLLALPARYVLRSVNEAFFDNHTPRVWKKFVDGLLDRFATNKVVNRLNKVLAEHPIPHLNNMPDHLITDVETSKALATPEGTIVQKKFEKILGRYRADNHTEEAVRYAYRTEGKGSGTTPKITEGYKGSKGDFRDSIRKHGANIVYDYLLGIGSLFLTTIYTRLVYKDIKNLFSETVSMDTGKKPEDVTYWDIARSDNKIIAKTTQNFVQKAAERYVTDLFFFLRPIPIFRSVPVGDLMIGVKAGMAFGDTWKRKTTMFEDLITFVNNKINPRNGLGQPISSGEIFDLYQHYAEAFHPQKMFSNVLERGTGEGALWASSQPIFQRMTDLMNRTYAYKHNTVLDPKTGHAVHQADFALPKFIYLLGHDMIDPAKPEQTLTMIEIANSAGITAVKEAVGMLAQGVTLATIVQQYHVTLPMLHTQKVAESEKNGVIAKGSTVQIEAADSPANKIDAATIHDYHAPEAALQRV